MTNQHPGDSWPRHCPRSYAEPTLVLEGRRSIHAAWPPEAVCESCGVHADGGYVGPVTGSDVTYPAPATRFACRPCARSSLGLTESDWSGHSCRAECSDTQHVDWVALDRDDLVDATPADRVTRFANIYAIRGWTVTSVQVEPTAPVVSGRFWAVTFQPTRLLW